MLEGLYKEWGDLAKQEAADQWLTCRSQGPERVLVEGESLLESVSSHLLVEHVTTREVQCGTVVLIVRHQSEIQPSRHLPHFARPLSHHYLLES